MNGVVIGFNPIITRSHLSAIRGVLRTSAVADYRVGMNETQYDGEYWIQK